ncbi:light-harvesting complex-like protein 3 isotype 1, chloroplastic [Lactuca sativa]|uniref:light-harvesting complex-like protein 3 isotype 1, chloroplastic n=1 Tax=Lactuca sativa TaxID=4236 RepID=UPI000CAE4AB0|nr:light-harvesting complex-like protein 3 isotype 1, chloroplastic [Lactuca sativa]
MASIGINAAMHRACSSSPHLTTKDVGTTPTRSLGSKQAATFVSLNVEAQKPLNPPQEQNQSNINGVLENGDDVTETCSIKFTDERWKHGTWDLNMFVKSGKMDWDALIVAEASRRKSLELHPEMATNEDPVVFRSSIIPWWAWITHSHLPEAELLNGRAAMIGFFMAYLVDVLTGLDVVGQSGNFICKICLLATVIGVVLFRQTKSIQDLKNLADEATFYDKQWQASWQDPDLSGSSLGKK